MFAWQLPFSPDEAHYALYGRFLDWSYFDHPPLVGWVQSVALLMGESEFLLRMPPILIGLLTGWLVFEWVKRSNGPKEAWLALLLFAITPMFRLLGLAWVPEIPLMLVGLLTLFCTQRIHAESRLSDWVALGVCLGLAALSKYTAVTLAVSVAWVLLLKLGLAGLLSQLGFWVMGLVALIVLSPILYWNWQHDWMSFMYQLNHGAGDSEWQLLKALRMQAGQIGTYGPLLYVGAIGASIWAYSQPRYRIHLVFAWPILLLFSILAAKGRSLPHWTAMGFLFLLPVIVAWLSHLWQGKHKIWITILALPSLLLTLAIGLVLSGKNLGYDDFKHPLQDLTGWNKIAQDTRDLALSDDLDHQQIFVPNWSFGSRYAWYARPIPVKILDTRVDQFDLWFGAAEQGDSGYLVLHQEKGRFHIELIERFANCEPVLEQVAQLDSVQVNKYKVYRCDDHE